MNAHRVYRMMLATLIVAVISGCTLGPDYRRQTMDMPEAWPEPHGDATVSAEWWKGYQDPALDAMIQEALAHNADLRFAIARVDEARANLGVARADQWPGVSANASAARTRTSEDLPLSIPAGVDPVNSNVRATLDVSYEIDFWGKYRRATEAARAELLASQFSGDAVRLALIADVSQGYFNLRALDAQVAITKRTVATRLDSLELQRKRFAAGVVSELELHQVEADAAQAQALLPVLETQLARQETALSVLLGRSPREIVGSAPTRGTAIEALTVPPAVPAGLPSDLLEHRPDLRQAEQQLVAANARIGQAKAAYFPSITLTGFLGGESTSLADLFSAPARIWQVSASAGQLVFDAGRTGSRVKAAQAREQEAVAQYQFAIQNAFKDTLDALVAQRKAREALDAEQARVAALQSALEHARLRYKNGVSSLLDVLDAERGLLAAELNRVEAQRVQLAATADLYKALGGGWDDSSEPERQTAAAAIPVAD